ncbi:hypothetical protein COY87_04470 [Candidatus Roizmanbacteria bacterium CG_4_10_14_0_8_um_filter_33_9]|uniref:ABC transporter domain-containing protein n=1 Tax=Candidatus Roizmanbacteria bacterium CG_4_10_14_0_8_um_filter_33_9 TaxID=1974826 RepID=A0A2M7QIF0_9BACT|nr:MAG: hypothetical protein COY87_04470 [Candidatus Roizmanbacteria bacterium CG_4_10_14_0_8_um_filter_33_9]
MKLVRLIKNIIWILKISYSLGPLKFIARICTIILYATLPILSFWILKLIIDQAVLSYVSKTTFNNLLYLVGLKIVLDLTWFFLDSLLEGLFKIMRFDLEAYFSHTVISKLNSMDLGFFEDSTILDLKQKALDTYSWRPTEMLNISFWSLYNLIQVTVQSMIIIQMNPLWLLLLYLFQIPAFLILLKIGQSAWNIWDADSTTRRKFMYFTGLFNNLAYIKEFKLYQVGDYFIEKIQNLLGVFHTNQKNIEKKRMMYGFSGVLLSNAPMFYITSSLLVKLIQKTLTPGLLTFYLNNLQTFASSLQNLVKNIIYGFEVNLYIDEIRRFLELPNKIIDPVKPTVLLLSENKVDINFNNISFTYPHSKRPVFKNFSLYINGEKKVAIVGENGSGKTTLIKLLCRFYDVQKGSITLNGIDIRSISQIKLHSLFSVLFQDYVGYDLTVKENIAMGSVIKIGNTNDIKKASQMAGVTEFVNSLPKKYNQLLGATFEGSEQLSIGQWQRIALAKVFMRNSPIMILDEPTAAVDAKTENEIFNKVMSLIKNKTVVMVSHRFSTVRQADEIVVIKAGQIIERGSHDRLMKSNGEYANMFNLQAKGYN